MLFHWQVITTIAALVAVLAAPTPDPRGASNGMVIPLTKHSSSLNVKKTVNIDVLISHVASHSAKIIHGIKSYERNTGTPHPSAVKRDGSLHSSGAGIDLTNWHNNELWYGTILVGTPSKSFTVQLDTGSSDLFVPTSTGDENCRSHHNLWDPDSSSTAKALTGNKYFSIEFEDGGITTGEQYRENVTIAGFTADIQTIGAASTYSSDMASSRFAPDGVLGLAFPPLSAYPASPLLHTLFSEGKLPKPMFSLKLTASGGELYLGGINEALYIDNSLAFAPITYPGFWQINLIDNIKVNDKIVLTDVHAVIDTGANFIVGDSSRVLALHQAYGGKAFKNSFYTFPCNSFPSVTFTIRKPFLIPANILGQGRVASSLDDCFSGIVAPPETDDADC